LIKYLQIFTIIAGHTVSFANEMILRTFKRLCFEYKYFTR